MSLLDAALAEAMGRGTVKGGDAEAARDSWPQALGWDRERLAALAPAAVATPADAEAAAAVLAWCSANGVAVVPRGAGSGVVGAAMPERAGCVLLDLRALSGIGAVEEAADGPAVRLGAGALGTDVEAALAARGWSLMHFPASLSVSTPGGWLACDSYGQLSTRHGPARAQALGALALLPDGSARREPAALHAGAEGRLGVLAEVTMRVRRAPARRRFAAFDFAEPAAALAFCRAAAAAAPPPSVLRLYSPADALLTGLRGGGGGNHGQGREVLERLALRAPQLLNAAAGLAGGRWLAVCIYEEEGEAFGAPPPAPGGRDAGPGPAERWWERRYHWSRDRLLRVFAGGCFADTADLWAPWEGLEALDAAVRAALAPLAFRFSHFSHFDAAGACLYVTFAGAGGPAAHARAWAAALDACAAAGGLVNHHHGVGLAKRRWLRRAGRADVLARLGAERGRRDPAGILNPGKLEEPPCP